MATERLTYEQQLFTWDGWDQGDNASFQFYNAQLKVDVGEYKAGTKFSTIQIDYSTSEITFWRDDLPEGKKLADGESCTTTKLATYALVAKVGAKLEAD